MLFLVGAIAVIAPSTLAQSSPITFTPTWKDVLTPTEPNMVPFNVTLQCSLIATKGGTVNVDVAATDAALWLNVTPARVAFPLTDCVTGQRTSLTKPGAVTLTATPDAPGLQPFNLTLVAQVVGSTEKATSLKESLVLAYKPGHVLTPAGDQTFRVTEATYAFPLRIDVTANTQTMVMFENKTVDVGALDGLRAYTFDVLGGERNVTYNVLYTPPEFNWTEARVKFHTYSHCLVGANCTSKLEQNLTWTFLNEQPPKPTPETSSTAPSSGGKSPSVGAVVALSAALVVALYGRRRKR